MKKIIFIIICILSLSVLLNAESINVKIINIEGGVTIQKANGNKISAAKGSIVSTGDIITTAQRSICDLEFSDNTYSRIGELSELKISEAESKEKHTLFGIKKDKKIKLDLAKGAFLSKMKKLGNKEVFEVKTPVAVVGVRGTNFQATSTPAGTNVSVYQGAVAVTNLTSNITSMVPAGQSFSISNEGGKSQAGSISSAEVSAAREISGEDIDAANFSGSVEAAAAEAKTSNIDNTKISEQVINVINNLNEIVKETKTTVIINFK